MTTLKLLALNLLLTLVAGCAMGVIAYQLVSFLAFWTHPPVYAFLYRGGGSIGSASLAQFLEHRHAVLCLGIIAGVVAVQVTFLVAPLRRPRL